ncbi:vascular endothelial growth factor receptor 1 [Elysia marginata]|uniref:Vascular endothelial growth factor receptor 1 n=1 Tax=Elysia marginata TaxID=1093978 RepID=A0AAV4JP99_9GAST|nr:vascular endothelial growth factor receptor 1 [Elysia marginata]
MEYKNSYVFGALLNYTLGHQSSNPIRAMRCLHGNVLDVRLICLLHLYRKEKKQSILGPPWPEPVFLPRLLNVTARHGGRALLPCAVHYLGTRQVTWRRLGSHHFLSVGDMAWVKDPNLEMEFRELTPEVSEWNLVIRNVTPADQGIYECKISDKNELFRHVRLRVIAQRPPVALSGKSYVETGHPIRLFCNVSGPEGLPLKIDWFKDGDSLQYPSPRNAIITNYNLVETNVLVSELFIDRSRSTDSGIYICRSTMGIKSKTVTVLFAGEMKVESSGFNHRAFGLLQLVSWISGAVLIHCWLLN